MRLIWFFAAAIVAGAQTAAPPRSSPRPAPRATAEASYKDLKYPALQPAPPPNIQCSAHANGLKICLWEDHELPLIDGMALVRTGSIFDPADKIGLAGMTGLLMRTGGIEGRTGEQIEELLETTASRLDVRVADAHSALGFSVLKENIEPVLGVFKAMLTAPAFQQERVEPVKNQLRNSIARRNDDSRAIARRELSTLIYGPENPYGWRPEYASIDRIQRADVQAFWRRYFFPANMLVAVRGDFDTAAMKAKIEALFADWTAKQDPVTNIPQPSNSPATGVYLAMRSGMSRTFFSIGEAGGQFKDPDYAAIEVANAIIGGGPRSRLFQQIRSNNIEDAEITSIWNAGFDHSGLFEIAGGVKPRYAVPVIQAIREEIEQMRTSEVSEEELKAARDAVSYQMIYATDTKPKLFDFLMALELYGYPRDFLQQLQKNIAAVTRADVLRAAKAHLDPARLTVLVVGTEDDFPEPLNRLGKITPISLAIAPPAKPEAAKAAPSNLERGKQLLERAQRAVGGAEKLAAIRDVIQQIEYKYTEAVGGASVSQTDRWATPIYYRQEIKLPSGWVISYYDGRYGWIANQDGSGPLSGPQLKRVEGDAFRMYFPLLLSDRIAGRTLNAIDDNVLEISDAGGQSVRIVLNKDTGLPEKLVYETVPISGPPVVVEEDWSDFHDVAGIMLPFKGVASQAGKKVADYRMSYQLNAGLKPDDLIKRP